MGQLISAVPNHGGPFSGPGGWTGNWSDPLMWDAGRVPGVGDWVVINSWGPVITVDIDVDFGHSPGTNDDNYAIMVGGGPSGGGFDTGHLIAAPGVTVNCRGDFGGYNGKVTFMPGSKLILDGTLASDPSTTRYVASMVGPGNNDLQAGLAEFLGTGWGDGEFVTVEPGSALQMPIIFDGNSMRRGGYDAPDFNAGEVHATFTKFIRVGDATEAGIVNRTDGYANDRGVTRPQVMFFEDVLFDACGAGPEWTYGLTSSSALHMVRVTFKNSPTLTKANYNQLSLLNAVPLTGSTTDFPRIVDDCSFDQPVDFSGSTDFEIHDNVHLAGCQTPAATASGAYRSNMLRRTDAAPDSDFLWKFRYGLVQQDNFYLIDGLNADGGLGNPTQQNPHWGFLQGGVGYGASKDSIFWYAGTDGQGDIHSMFGGPDTNDPTTNVYDIVGCISLPSLSGGSPGCFTTVLGGYTIGGQVNSHNNTIATGHGSEVNTSEGGHHLHEGTDDFAGEFGRISSNITWATAYDSSTLRGSCVIQNIGGGATALDPVAPTDADYNLHFNLDGSTTSTVAGATVTTPGYRGINFSAMPGVHDLVDVDPQFVDPTRNVITWAVANGFSTSVADDAGKAAAIAYAMDQMAGKNQPGYDATWSYANLLSYIRTGFTPRNRLLQVSHPTDLTAGFAYVGALPVLVQGGSVRFTVIP